MAGHASRSRISRWSASSSGAACVVERTSTCCPRLDIEAVARQQRGESLRVGPHPTIAAARHQPADAPATLTGRQLT
jgi:hypothetical protein